MVFVKYREKLAVILHFHEKISLRFHNCSLEVAINLSPTKNEKIDWKT